MDYKQIAHIIESKSDDDLKSLSKTEIYVFLKSLKEEMTRRLTPRQRGKYNRSTGIAPVPKEVYEGCRRLTLEWIRRKNATKQ